MYHEIDATLQTAARKLVKTILAHGHTIGVYDGEEWACKKSTDPKAIWDAMGNTDTDRLCVRDASGEVVGQLYIIWEGTPDELVYDYSANDATECLYTEWFDTLPAKYR